MITYDADLKADFIVTIPEVRKVVSAFSAWTYQTDTRGYYRTVEHITGSGTCYFSDQDTAVACLLIFGEILQVRASELPRYPFVVEYRGARDVDTLAELRAWLNELPERSWVLETEKFISSTTFIKHNNILIRFASRDEAFSFKIRWHTADRERWFA